MARVLEAATASFGEKGFHSATFEDIIAASGLSRGSLYWHFDSKEQLYEAALDYCASRLDEELTSKLADVCGGVDAAPRILQLIASDVRANEERYRVLYSVPESVRLLGKVQLLNAIFVRHVAAVLDGENDEDASTDAGLADLVLALVDGMIYRHLSDPDFDMERFLDTARRLFGSRVSQTAAESRRAGRARTKTRTRKPPSKRSQRKE